MNSSSSPMPMAVNGQATWYSAIPCHIAFADSSPGSSAKGSWRPCLASRGVEHEGGLEPLIAVGLRGVAIPERVASALVLEAIRRNDEAQRGVRDDVERRRRPRSPRREGCGGEGREPKVRAIQPQAPSTAPTCPLGGRWRGLQDRFLERIRDPCQPCGRGFKQRCATGGLRWVRLRCRDWMSCEVGGAEGVG